MNDFPKLINEISQHNTFDLNYFLNSGIPWLKLNIDVPEFDQTVLDEAVQQSTNWRKKWNFSNKSEQFDVDYQIKEWNGSLLFGPSDWERWLKIVENDNNKNDEDHLCMLYRNDLDFSWRIKKSHPIRKFVESIFPSDRDVNIVNFYVLPPGGYLFPHIDPTQDDKALNKIYIPLKWKQGNEFGFYKFGNAPFKQNRAYLINNYRYVHWVLNRSDEPRVVLDIGSNLHSIADLIQQSYFESF